MLVVVVIAGAATALTLVAGSGHSATDSPSARSRDSDRPPVPVTVQPVQYRTVQESIEAVGTLQAYEVVSISAEVDGRVQRLRHDVADRVKPGEPLLEIDSTDYRLSLERAQKSLEADLSRLGLQSIDGQHDVERLPAVQQARARLENAANQLKRIQPLLQERAVSRQEYDDAAANHAVAQAEYIHQRQLGLSALTSLQDRQLAIAIAREKLDDTVVRAPVPSRPIPGAAALSDGVTYAITERLVAEGEFVRAGTELFRMVIDRPLKMVAAIPERHAEDIRPGQKAVIRALSHRETIEGEVWRINPAIDPATRTFKVEILVANAEGGLMSGGFAKATILTRENPHVATVPLEALVTLGGTTKVFLLKNDRARAVAVQLGKQTAEWAEIVHPALPENGAVLSSGLAGVVDGSAVSIRTAAAAAREVAR